MCGATDGTILYFSRPELNQCVGDLALLEPRNDSSGNLKLLLEQYVFPTLKSTGAPALKGGYGEPIIGTCITNTVESANMFATALNASSVSEPDKIALNKLRSDLVSRCSVTLSFQDWAASVPVALAHLAETENTRDWLAYVKAAFILYNGDSEEAVTLFSELRKSKEAWIHETALYMQGRVRLITAQKLWDGYLYSVEKIDKKLVQDAEAILLEYRTEFPNGAYARSARGLSRRALRLRNDEKAYRERLFEDFEDSSKNGTIEEVASISNELEQFLYGWANETTLPFAHPLLAAEVILIRSRSLPFEEKDLQDLDAARASFSSFPGLFDLLRGYMLLGMKRYQEVAKLDPAPDVKSTMVGRSQLVVKATALERINDFDAAQRIWRDLIVMQQSQSQSAADDDTLARLKVALLRNRLLANKRMEIARAPLGEYPELTETFQQVYRNNDLAEIVADTQIPQVHREAAATALLHNHLIREEWSDFVKVYETQNEKVQKQFTEIAPKVRILKANPSDPRSLLEIGRYQENFGAVPENSGVQDYPSKSAYSILGAIYPLDQYKGMNSAKGAELRPLEYYQRAKVAADKDKSADPELKAEILSRMIACFHWTDCYYYVPKDSVPKKTRAKWFAELQGKYKNTTWAKDTEYYY